LKRDFETAGGTVVVGAIATQVHAAALPEAVLQSRDSRTGCVWWAAMGAGRLACLRELKSATAYVTMPGCHGHGWGEHVLPVQL